LLVSSRASFEIVHKAIVAGFSTVLCLSAPTSLAVDLADQCGILLAGFFRSGGFNVYSGHSRLIGEHL
jgi:FdhD protein